MRRTALACLAAAAALAAPATAAADEVTGAELRSLAAQAGSDPAALERLRTVDRVDGRPVDVAGSLRGAQGEDLRARLELLAAAPPREPPAADARAARAEAQRILAGRRFRGTELRGPFRGVLERIGRELDRVGGLIPRLDRALPGGRAVAWVLVVAAIAGLTWLIAGRTISRRAALAAAAGPRAGGARAESPAALERRAEEAERRGAHEEALRLRFRAGLLRLDARGTIEFRPSLPTGDVARTLRSADFDRLAADFDEVVYGRRPANAGDVEVSRTRWAAVLEGTR